MNKPPSVQEFTARIGNLTSDDFARLVAELGKSDGIALMRAYTHVRLGPGDSGNPAVFFAEQASEKSLRALGLPEHNIEKMRVHVRNAASVLVRLDRGDSVSVDDARILLSPWQRAKII